DLISSTLGITVVVGFPFTASPESPSASEARGFVSAGNGRTSTAPSRPDVVAWPIARQGFYGGQPTGISRSRAVTWSESLPSSQHDRVIRRTPLTYNASVLQHNC